MAGRPLVAFSVAVATLLLVPSAVALPGEGTIVAEGGLSLDGDVAVRLASGGVAWNDPADLVVDGTAGAVTLTLYSYREVLVSNPLTGGFSYWRRDAPQVVEATDASLALGALEPGAEVAVSGEALQANVVLAGAVLQGYEYRFLTMSPIEVVAAPEAYYVLRVDEAVTAESGAARLHATGAATMYVWNATVVVDGQEYATGTFATEADATIPFENVRETRYVWAVLELAEADLVVEGDRAVLGGDASYTIDGGVRASRADADFTVDGVRRTAVGAPFSLEGAVEVLPYRVSTGSRDLASGEAVSADPTLAARVSGDVRELSAGAARVRDPRVAAGAAAGGVLLLSFLGWALYTRLAKPVLLDNDVRAEIYRIVCATPGIGAREVHRQSGRSWGTVVYHLRQLEKHSLIKSKRFGRLRNFYENHGKWGGQETMLAALKGTKTLAIARAIVARPGLHQELLVTETGLPQSTVSYRVKRLREAGLVEERRESRFASYFPTADLERLLVVRSARPDLDADDTEDAPPAPAGEGAPAA